MCLPPHFLNLLQIVQPGQGLKCLVLWLRPLSRSPHPPGQLLFATGRQSGPRGHHAPIPGHRSPDPVHPHAPDNRGNTRGAFNERVNLKSCFRSSSSKFHKLKIPRPRMKHARRGFGEMVKINSFTVSIFFLNTRKMGIGIRSGHANKSHFCASAIHPGQIITNPADRPTRHCNDRSGVDKSIDPLTHPTCRPHPPPTHRIDPPNRPTHSPAPSHPPIRMTHPTDRPSPTPMPISGACPRGRWNGPASSPKRPSSGACLRWTSSAPGGTSPPLPRSSLLFSNPAAVFSFSPLLPHVSISLPQRPPGTSYFPPPRLFACIWHPLQVAPWPVRLVPALFLMQNTHGQSLALLDCLP